MECIYHKGFDLEPDPDRTPEAEICSECGTEKPVEVAHFKCRECGRVYTADENGNPVLVHDPGAPNAIAEPAPVAVEEVRPAPLPDHPFPEEVKPATASGPFQIADKHQE